jgi:hypothetical protein
MHADRADHTMDTYWTNCTAYPVQHTNSNKTDKRGRTTVVVVVPVVFATGRRRSMEYDVTRTGWDVEEEDGEYASWLFPSF